VAIYKWAVGNISSPTDPALVATNFFSDGVAGDTITGQSSTSSNVFTGGCGGNTNTLAELTAIVDLGCLSLLTALSVTHNHTVSESAITPCVSTPDPGNEPDGATGTLYAYYWDENTSAWVQIATPAWTMPGGTTSFVFPAVSTRLIKILCTTRYEVFYDAATIGATARITDIRHTESLLAPASSPSLTVAPDCAGGLDITVGTVLCASAYEYRVNFGAWTAIPGASFNISGLTPSLLYTFEARGTNSGGAGPATTATAIVDQGCGGGGGAGSSDDGSIPATSTVTQDCTEDSSMTKAAT